MRAAMPRRSGGGEAAGGGAAAPALPTHLRLLGLRDHRGEVPAGARDNQQNQIKHVDTASSRHTSASATSHCRWRWPSRRTGRVDGGPPRSRVPVNTKDEVSSSTALHLTARRARQHSVLLENKADRTIKNRQGLVAADLAWRKGTDARGHIECARQPPRGARRTAPRLLSVPPTSAPGFGPRMRSTSSTGWERDLDIDQGHPPHPGGNPMTGGRPSAQHDTDGDKTQHRRVLRGHAPVAATRKR